MDESGTALVVEDVSAADMSQTGTSGANSASKHTFYTMKSSLNY